MWQNLLVLPKLTSLTALCACFKTTCLYADLPGESARLRDCEARGRLVMVGPVLAPSRVLREVPAGLGEQQFEVLLRESVDFLCVHEVWRLMAPGQRNPCYR